MHEEVMQPDITFKVSDTFEPPIVTLLRPFNSDDAPLFMD
jgi:hypothetical protein